MRSLADHETSSVGSNSFRPSWYRIEKNRFGAESLLVILNVVSPDRVFRVCELILICGGNDHRPLYDRVIIGLARRKIACRDGYCDEKLVDLRQQKAFGSSCYEHRDHRENFPARPTEALHEGGS